MEAGGREALQNRSRIKKCETGIGKAVFYIALSGVKMLIFTVKISNLIWLVQSQTQVRTLSACERDVPIYTIAWDV
jgi:uncharacterized membrane protein YGL010W